MLRLNLSRDPRWVDLGHGVRVRALPLTSAILLSLSGDPSLEGGENRSPVEQALIFAKAVASRVVTEWEGVGDENGNVLAVTREAASALMDVFPLYRAFEANYIVPWLRLESEKNVSAPLASGISAGRWILWSLREQVPQLSRKAECAGNVRRLAALGFGTQDGRTASCCTVRRDHRLGHDGGACHGGRAWHRSSSCSGSSARSRRCRGARNEPEHHGRSGQG